jgi:alpha-tubulin suppressor-like RCC1 family protein
MMDERSLCYNGVKESLGDFMRKLIIIFGFVLLLLSLTTTIKRQPQRYVTEDLEIETIRQSIETYKYGIFIIDEHGLLFGMGGTEIESLIFEHSDQLIPLNDYFSLEEDEYFISIHASDDNALALTSNHRLFSWGQNAYGETGSGVEEKWVNVPIDITDHFNLSDDEGIAQIIMKPQDQMMNFTSASFVLTNKGILYGWGHNYRGNFGLHDQYRNLGIEYYDVNIYGYYIVSHPYRLNHEFNLGFDEIIVSISPIAALTSYGRLMIWNQGNYLNITEVTQTIEFQEYEHLVKIDDGGEFYWTNHGRILSLRIYYREDIVFHTLMHSVKGDEISSVLILESFKIASRTSIILVNQPFEILAKYGGGDVPMGINPLDMNVDQSPNRNMMTPIIWGIDLALDEYIVDIKMNSSHLLILTSKQRLWMSGNPSLNWRISEDHFIRYEIKELKRIDH